MEPLLVALVIWSVAFALPAAWLAGERGRSGLVWFLVGLLLGPVAILILGFAPILPEGRYRHCVECLETILEGATRCPSVRRRSDRGRSWHGVPRLIEE